MQPRREANFRVSDPAESDLDIQNNGTSLEDVLNSNKLIRVRLRDSKDPDFYEITCSTSWEATLTDIAEVLGIPTSYQPIKIYVEAGVRVTRIKDIQHGQRLLVVANKPITFGQQRPPVQQAPSPYDPIRSSGLIYFGRPEPMGEAPFRPHHPRPAPQVPYVRGRSKSAGASQVPRPNMHQGASAFNPIPPQQFPAPFASWTTTTPTTSSVAFQNNFMMAPFHMHPFPHVPPPVGWSPWISHHVSGPSPSTDVPPHMSQTISATFLPHPLLSPKPEETAPKTTMAQEIALDAMDVVDDSTKKDTSRPKRRRQTWNLASLRANIKKEDFTSKTKDAMDVDSDVEMGVKSLETLRNSTQESALLSAVKKEDEREREKEETVKRTPTRVRASSASIPLDLATISEEDTSDDEYREAMSRRRSASLSAPTKRVKIESKEDVEDDVENGALKEAADQKRDDNVGPIDWSQSGLTASVPQRSGFYDRDKFLASLDQIAARCTNKLSPLTKEQALLKAQETINSPQFRADFDKFYPKAVRRVALQQRGIVRGSDFISKESKISALIRCEPPMFVFFFLGRTLCANAVSSRLKGVVSLLPVMLVRHSFPIDDWSFKKELDEAEQDEHTADHLQPIAEDAE